VSDGKDTNHMETRNMDNQEAFAKLQELIDREEIRDVLMRYCRGCDRGNAEMIASAFHEDGIDQHDIPRPAADLAKGAAAVYMPHMMHFTGNVLIELDGDMAHVESYFMSFSSPDEEGKLSTRTRAARYLDRFERRNGVWKIAYRLVVDEWARIDLVTEVPDNVGACPGSRDFNDPVYHMDERLRLDQPVASA
jgi:hypothetical protein